MLPVLFNVILRFTYNTIGDCMSYIIFLISIIGICCVCFTMENYWYLSYEKKNKNTVQIILTKEYADYEEKKEIIDNIMCGNYENVLDIVDNVRIN